MRAPGNVQLLLACALILALASGMGTAFARGSDGSGVEAFSRALSAYESGDLALASATIDDAMKSGLSKDLQARAINLRAHINERNGALARALQDYSNAIWMDTLPPNERKDAQDGKQRVIAAMGLNSYDPSAKHTDASSESSQGSSGWSMFGLFGSSSPAPRPAPTPAPPPAPVKAAQAAPQSSQSGGGWSMFNMFGSSSPAPEQAPAQAPVQTAAATPAPGPATSASAIVTRAKPAAAAPPAPAPVPVARAAAPRAASPVRMAAIQPNIAAPASAAGGYMILFGVIQSEAAGRARAGQIKAALADILVSRTVDVEAGATGGYQIVAGPYKAKPAALSLCQAMKQRGVSCTVTP